MHWTGLEDQNHESGTVVFLVKAPKSNVKYFAIFGPQMMNNLYQTKPTERLLKNLYSDKIDISKTP